MDPLHSGVWLTTADGVIGKYCNSGNPTLIMANQEHDKFVLTKDLVLQPGDVIQFKVRVNVNTVRSNSLIPYFTYPKI